MYRTVLVSSVVVTCAVCVSSAVLVTVCLAVKKAVKMLKGYLVYTGAKDLS